MKDHEPVEKKTASRVGRAMTKGFFIALALCLIGVGGMAVSTFTATQKNLNTSPSTTTGAPFTTTDTTTSAAPAAAKPATTTGTSVPDTTTSTTATKALFVLPLSNRVITSYTETPVWSETMEDYRPHTALDFAGEPGQSVRALASGTVSSVEKDAMWSESLTIEHGDGVVSVYRGLEVTVEVGAMVEVGEPVGTLAVAPCESAMEPHLHLELYRDSKTVDPSTLLSGQLTTLDGE